MKHIGVLAHSADGAALCFLEAVRESARRLGEHHHPEITLSVLPMAPVLEAYDKNDLGAVKAYLAQTITRLANAGCDFFVCPDNTAHIVLEKIVGDLPLPGLHIAEVVSHEISKNGYKQVGLLGTRWTMTGPVYRSAMEKRDCELLVPDESTREQLNTAIFDELCNGIFNKSTTDLFLDAIEDLKSRGAECVILGCTEIPLIVTPQNSSLPTFDSTRLLAKYAVLEAISDRRLPNSGWLPVA